MNVFRALFPAFILLAVTACGSTKAVTGLDYTKYKAASPRSILVVPVINHSNETQAADIFLTTLAVPLAERGYYVFPTNMSKKLVENEGLSDPGLVHSTPTPKMAALFNADSVLYVEILDWKSRYAVTSSVVEVKFLYTMKDGRTGDLLWQREQAGSYSYTPDTGNILGNLLATAIKSMVDNGRADYSPVAVQANAAALAPARIGLPYGPYSPNGNMNDKEFPTTGSGKLTDATAVATAFPVQQDQ